jgi:hypothetical protein
MMPFVISRSHHAGRRVYLTGSICLFGILAAYILSGYIANNQFGDLELFAAAVAVCVLVATILNNWRRGLLIFIGWLLFEDLVRKYLGNNMAIYFGKDVLAAVFYLSFFMAVHRLRLPLFRPPFRVPLLIIIWFGIIQLLNPGSPSIFYGLMGFKMFYFYVPLMFVGYSLFDSEQDLRRFFFVNLFFLLIIASLGIAQSILGHTFLNPEHIQEDIRDLATLYRTSPITGLRSYRPTSVFVSTGRFANFLIVGWVITLGFTAYMLFRQRKGRLFVFVVFVVTAAALVLSASRGAFMWQLINTLVFAAAFLWGAPWRTKEVIRVLRTIQRTALGLGVAFLLLFYVFPDALKARLSFYEETLSPDSEYSELANRTRDYPIANFLLAFSYDRWPYGYGIGTSGLGTQYVSRLFHVRPIEAGVESGYGAIVIEQGIVGLVLWILFSSAVVLSAWRVVLRLRGSPWFPLAFAISWYIFMLLFPFTFAGLAAYEDFVLNAYLWLFLGILFRLPELELSRKFALAGANAEPVPSNAAS